MEKTKLSTYSLTPRHREMIDEISEKGQYLSKSDVVRKAIDLLHKKEYPYYKVKEEVKAEEIIEQEELRKLPDEEFIQKVFGDDVEIKGQEVIITHRNNPVWEMIVPFEDMRQYTSRKAFWEAAGHPEI